MTNEVLDSGILKGIRVLDLTQYLAGPHATLLLAGSGAEVIRVDNPHTGDALTDAPFYFGAEGASFDKRDESDLGVAFLKRLRQKKSITLDLKSAEGRALFHHLVDISDVVVENFAVGVTGRLGVDWPTLHAINPGLIYCSLTGLGSTGPDKNLRAYDLTVQAMSGIMALTGDPDGPPMKAGSPLADTVSAGFAYAGVLGALYHRERTGRGQFVDVSMVDVLFSLMFDDPLESFADIGVPQRHGNRVPRLCPFNTYPSTDGWLVVCCGNDDMWRRVCAVIGREDLAKDSWGSMSWRIANYEQVDAVVSAWTATRSTSDAVDALVAGQVAASPVKTIDDLLDWPHLHARAMIDDVVHPTLGKLPLKAAGFPIKYSGAPSGYPEPAAPTGTHTRQILQQLLELSDAELDDLAARSVI